MGDLSWVPFASGQTPGGQAALLEAEPPWAPPTPSPSEMAKIIGLLAKIGFAPLAIAAALGAIYGPKVVAAVDSAAGAAESDLASTASAVGKAFRTLVSIPF